MRLRLMAAVAALSVTASVPVAAQDFGVDFGVMNSAETINRGNFKLLVNPIIIFGEQNAENETGVAFGGGYGVTDNFDIEGKVAIFDGLTFFGADAEYWLVKERPVDVSLSGGFHLGRRDGFDTTGIDFTFMGSGHVQPRLEVFTAVDLTRNFLNDSDQSFMSAHLVPGIEYAINSTIDLLAELGIGLTDDAANYFSVGIAYYVR